MPPALTPTLWPWTLQLSEAVASQSVSDEAIIRAMVRCWEENRYLLCPHSAVAVSYHYQQMDGQQPRCGRGVWVSGPFDSQGPCSSPSRGHGTVGKGLQWV